MRARLVRAAPDSHEVRGVDLRYKHVTTAVLTTDGFGGAGIHHFVDHLSRYPVEVSSCRRVDFGAAIETAVNAEVVLLTHCAGHNMGTGLHLQVVIRANRLDATFHFCLRSYT